MAEPDLKKRLLQTLAVSAEREGELHRLSVDPLPANPSEWGARDHVAHLAHWRRYAAQVLTAVRTGGTPPDAADIDAVHEAAFTDPRSRAFGEYNLACYYARQGRSTDAIPHIKRSLELHPALREWARKDKDLDRIREEPALRAILE